MPLFVASKLQAIKRTNLTTLADYIVSAVNVLSLVKLQVSPLEILTMISKIWHV